MSLKVNNPDKFRSNIVKKITALVGDEKKAKNIEKSVFNYSIRESKNRKIVRKWKTVLCPCLYR